VRDLVEGCAAVQDGGAVLQRALQILRMVSAAHVGQGQAAVRLEAQELGEGAGLGGARPEPRRVLARGSLSQCNATWKCDTPESGERDQPGATDAARPRRPCLAAGALDMTPPPWPMWAASLVVGLVGFAIAMVLAINAS
jgi:hypothetical protein